jgi:hypothetical protein
MTENTDQSMRRRTNATRPIAIVSALAAAWLLSGSTATAQEDVAEQAYQILQTRCVTCHGSSAAGGLDLRTHASLIKGGSSGRALIPHDPLKSRLYTIAAEDKGHAGGKASKLPADALETLRTWIDEGGSLESVAEAMPVAAKPEAPKPIEDRPITAEERQLWAFRRPLRSTVAAASDPAWNKNPIDAFLFATFKAKGLQPSPRADRRTLIRRAYQDLIGLPPTPAEVDAFVNDRAPDAWPRLVERLLASPHYGERWARYWLDLVRYADSGGFEFDVDRPQAWRYRDYVVNSFNQDKPYAQFVREQIAGDEYAPVSSVSNDAMVATGFLRLGPDGGGNSERGRQEQLDDLVTTTTLTFMGTTVACARCHDHKFDPIPQMDYYRIQAVFFPTRGIDHPLVPAHEVAVHRKETERIDGLIRPLRQAKREIEAPFLKQLVDAEVAKLPDYLRTAWNTPAAQRTEGQKLNVAQIERTLQNDTLRNRISESAIVALMDDGIRQKHAELLTQIAVLEKQKPAPFPAVRAISETGREAKPSYFLHRGSVDSKGPEARPGILSVTREADWDFASPPPEAKSSWRRRGFAEWLTSPENPLTARVMVNRIWQHHFGEGIVRTPSNFGKMGDKPTHPELLDWLALEFIARDWSVKAMQRLMLTSEAYQMSSRDMPENLAIDPQNRLFWRMPRQRLDAETIRDQILAVAGTLDRTLGGPNVFPYIDPDLFEKSSKRDWPGKPDDDPSTWRRSLYVFSKRSIRYPMFETFDQPNLVNSVDRRNRSTVAPQALILMNNAFVIFQAAKLAERLRREAGRDAAAQIDLGFQLALGRKPDADERRKTLALVKAGDDGLAQFCHVLFNLNEFVYRQ